MHRIDHGDHLESSKILIMTSSSDEASSIGAKKVDADVDIIFTCEYFFDCRLHLG